MQFQGYELKDFIVKAIKDLGFKDFSTVQKDVFNSLKENKNLLVRSKTGSGKTHAFLIPIFNEGLIYSLASIDIIGLTIKRQRHFFDLSLKKTRTRKGASIDYGRIYLRPSTPRRPYLVFIKRRQNVDLHSGQHHLPRHILGSADERDGRPVGEQGERIFDRRLEPERRNRHHDRQHRCLHLQICPQQHAL